MVKVFSDFLRKKHRCDSLNLETTMSTVQPNW